MESEINNPSTEINTNNVLVAVKLTKKVLSDFICWTTTKYNDYLGYGTKREAVLTAYYSLLKGCLVQVYVYNRDTKFHKKGDLDIRENPNVKIVEFQCSGSSGENQHQRLWRTKQGGEQYLVDCIDKTITAKKSNRVLKFDLSM